MRSIESVRASAFLSRGGREVRGTARCGAGSKQAVVKWQKHRHPVSRLLGRFKACGALSLLATQNRHVFCSLGLR